MKQPIRRDDLIAELMKYPNDEVLIMSSNTPENRFKLPPLPPVSEGSHTHTFKIPDGQHTFNIRAVIPEPFNAIGYDANGETISESAIIIIMDD